MDLISGLKSELFRPLVTLAIPGAIAVGPFVLVALDRILELSGFRCRQPSTFAVILALTVLAAGLILEDVGARIEILWDALMRDLRVLSPAEEGWQSRWSQFKKEFKDAKGRAHVDNLKHLLFPRLPHGRVEALPGNALTATGSVTSTFQRLPDDRAKAYPNAVDEWHEYLQLSTKDEIVGQRYLRTILTRMKFEITTAPALVLHAIGLNWANSTQGFLDKRQILFVTLGVLALGLYLLYESWTSAHVLARLRHDVIVGVKGQSAPSAPAPGSHAATPP